MTIKAIETVYKGYKFRSRLEARWAVFFDTLGLEWQYEVEGFEFEGKRYLPDFWLPTAKTWIEVKPKGEKLPLSYLIKINSFSNEIGQLLIVLCGEPYRWEFDVIIMPSSRVKWLAGVTSFPFVDFIISDNETAKENPGVFEIFFLKENGDPVGVVKIVQIPEFVSLANYAEAYDIIEHAYLTARQARFERH